MVFAAVKKDGAGKRRPKQNAIEKHSEERKDTKTQNLADERRITGRFAKRRACISQAPAKVPFGNFN